MIEEESRHSLVNVAPIAGIRTNLASFTMRKVNEVQVQNDHVTLPENHKPSPMFDFSRMFYIYIR